MPPKRIKKGQTGQRIGRHPGIFFDLIKSEDEDIAEAAYEARTVAGALPEDEDPYDDEELPP